MKTLKSILVVALVAATMVSFASADGFKIQPKAKKIVNISFERAIKNPGLLLAMYHQLDQEFLHPGQKVFVVRVNYDNSIYQITGTYDQWAMFFKMDWKLPVHYDKIMMIDR